MSSSSGAARPEEVAAFEEALSFLTSDREDVRKMAIHGVAAQSKDSAALCEYLRSKPKGAATMDVLLLHMHVGSSKILGDILTVLINVCIDAEVTETLIKKHIVRKSMRLLDGLQLHVAPNSDIALSIVPLEELTLMLLCNLTTTSVLAVDDVLQKDDEDMRGFYLGKLLSLYQRKTEEEEEDRKAAEEAEETAEEGAAAPPPRPPPRDIRRWILRLILNISRCVDGQEQLLEDEAWREVLVEGLSAPQNPAYRLLSAQIISNCAMNAEAPYFKFLLQSKVVVKVIARLTSHHSVGIEPVTEIQVELASIVARVLESEEAMAELEGMNAKRLLEEVVKTSQKAHEKEVEGEAQVVEVTEGEEQPEAKVPSLSPGVVEFLVNQVLPYLDDVIDAYLAPGSEALD